MNKTYNLNSSQELNWQLYFGLQDENAPSSPDDLSKGSFQIIPAIVPGNVEIDLEKAGKEDVFKKVIQDFKAVPTSVDEAEIRDQMEKAFLRAKEDFKK